MVISKSGKDCYSCNETLPCRTIGFALSRRAVENDIIKIDNGKNAKPFFVDRSFSLFRNISLQGFNGQATISAKSPLWPAYLFEEKGAKQAKTVRPVTLRIENLIFQRIGIVRITSVSPDKSISFENCHFENVTASQDIIRLEGESKHFYTGHSFFSYCNFTKNVAENFSSLIKIKHLQSVFEKCHYIDNLSKGNGSISLIGAVSIFKYSHFRNNTAGWHGGIIYASALLVLKILNCFFQENAAHLAGGAIFVSAEKLIIRRSSFEHNIVSGSLGRGGAIFSHVTTRCEIFMSFFIRNLATLDGGAICNCRTKPFIKRSLFKKSFPLDKQGNGRAVTSNHPTIFSISSSSFEQNQVKSFGGAIFNDGSSLNIKTSFFVANNAFGLTGRRIGKWWCCILTQLNRFLYFK